MTYATLSCQFLPVDYTVNACCSVFSNNNPQKEKKKLAYNFKIKT